MGRTGKSSKVAGAVEAADETAAAEPESIRLAVKLPPKQRAALQGYRAGCGNAEAAKLADVDPSTISRWLTHDAKFIAAHNAVILETVKAANADSASLLPLANAAIRKQLEKGNGWLALQFYREARSIGAFEVGPTTVAAVKKELNLAQELHENQMLKKELEIQQQQQEIEKLRQQISRNQSTPKQMAIDEGYWYAFMAFYKHWTKERETPVYVEHNAEIEKREQAHREENAKYDEAEKVYTKEVSLKVIAEADRLQQLDQEKKQRGERVKPVDEQFDALHRKHIVANWQRTRELEQQEQQRKAQQAAEQASSQPAVAQPAQDAGQPSRDSGRTLSEYERWELDHEEADREMEEQDELEEQQEREEEDAHHRDAEAEEEETPESAATTDHLAADVNDKSNPGNPPPAPQRPEIPPVASSVKYVIDEDGEAVPVDDDVDRSG